MPYETRAHIAKGLCDDGETDYVPGVNCWDCGRFVGRDGYIAIGHFESSELVAYVEGQCRSCGDRAADDHEESEQVPA